VLVAASALLAPVESYLHLLGQLPRLTEGYLASNMIGIRGLAATIGAPWLYLAGIAVIVPLTLVAAWQSDAKTGFSSALAGSMLCAYHINGYGATMSAICLVALLEKVEDYAGKVLLAAAILWVGRPPMWLSPLILLGRTCRAHCAAEAEGE
jgi:hypothetical protein